MNNIKKIIKNIPILGYIFQIIYYLVFLPKYIKKIQSIEDENKNYTNLLDDFYIKFEDRFRGKREDIKNRQSYYLDILNKTVTNDDMILDIGCGRGEFLELLKDNNLKAKGIDLNKAMINQSLSYNLDVTYDEAIHYLQNQKEESFKVITAFHFVEHISFENLLLFFELCFKVLKKDGLIIFETPNPENLHVGSCSFYTDPTHKNPIPPTLLEFIAQYKGYKDIQVHKLTPLKDPKLLDIKNAQDVNNLLKYANQAQDYSIVAYKR
jgi:O-antigen chain-terminating methyltransferase